METKNYQPVTVGKRLLSMLLDYAAICAAGIIIGIPYFVIKSFVQLEFIHPLIGAILVAFLFCKDTIDGQSLGKRIIGLQVVNKLTGKKAGAFRCLIRNIFILIWPVELVFCLINPERRFGDMVAGTKVVFFDKTKENTSKSIVYPLICFLLILIIAFILLTNSGIYDLPLIRLLNNMPV